MDKRNNTGPGMTAPVEQQTPSSGGNPSSTVDDNRHVEGQGLAGLLKPIVRQILEEMLLGSGGKSPEELSRRSPLVRAVCAELVAGGAIDRSAQKIVGERLGDRIDCRVDFVLGSRLTEGMRTLALSVASGDVFLTVKEAASIASCSERTIRRALESAELRRFWVGNDPRVRLGDLRDSLARRRPVAPDGAGSDQAGGVEPDEGPNRGPGSSGEDVH